MATFSVFDNITISESIAAGVTPLFINVFDAVTVSEAAVEVDMFKTFMDIASTLVTSGYKWLTQTLLTAEQAFTVRPYFTLKVIDDSIKPTSVSILSTTPPSRGAAANTPDDNVVAAGIGADNKIHFYKGRNLAGGWDKDVILDNDASIISANANNQVAIATSEYVNGSYHVDVAYFVNFDGSLGPNVLGVRVQSSDDGGLTWAATTTFLVTPGIGMLWSNYNIASPPNLYLTLMKPRLINGVMNSAFIFPQVASFSLSSGNTPYQLMYCILPGGIITNWGTSIDSGDWTIHSFDSFFINGFDYVVFTGFRNIIDTANTASSSQNPNYALWLTKILRRATLSYPVDSWSPPVLLIPSGSSTFVNQNQFTYPKAAVQNGYVDIILKAVTVDSVSLSAQGSNSNTITTHENYLLIRSKDGENFTYPQIIVDKNNNEILEPNSNAQLQSFVKQDGFYYICGGAQIYQFIFNNTVADLTSDVIGYSVQEIAGQPSSIHVQVANQNNQWFGSASPNQGAAAIIRNSKIALWQGYYNADGVAELVPKNVFFIDDITQEISGKKNNLALVGRDWFKKLKTFITRYSLQWVGPFFYTDVFDGTSLSSWNQQQGTWIEQNNQILPDQVNVNDSILTFGKSSQIPFGSLMLINATNPPDGGKLYIYAFYIDADHFLRLNIKNVLGVYTWQVEKGVLPGVAPAILDSGTFTWTGSGYYTFFVRQYDYYKWSFMFTAGTAFAGNPLSAFAGAQILKGTTNGEFNLRTTNFAVIDAYQKTWSVGFGCNNAQIPFGYFRYTQFGPVTNVFSVAQAIATRAGILDTKAQMQFADPLVVPNFAGNFSVVNRKLVIPVSGKVMNSDPALKIGNGELIFTAKSVPINQAPGGDFGFSVIFRADDTMGANNAYRLRFRQFQNGAGFVYTRFERLLAGAFNLFPNSCADDQVTTPLPQFGSLNIDLTTYHQYRITMVDGWLYAYVDGLMVAAWNDNNTTSPFLTTGFWGFQTNDSNSNVTVKDIYSPAFWKPVPSFSFNPADDAENAIKSLITSIRGWIFSDLIGRMKMILLSSANPSTFTYDNQIWGQDVDLSDKEYVSQVTVYGSGVSATARNTSLMPGVSVRESVIVDYSLNTMSDAQTRANNELLNSNQFISQFAPKQTINVGAELFDSITVVNVGNNTSQQNTNVRVYGQTFIEGGGDNTSDYSIELQTGHI